MNSFKDWKILGKPLFIGEGAHWKVYRAFLEKEESINEYKFSQFIYKINKNKSEFEVKQNITVYNYIKNTGLPTLKFYFSEVLNGIDVIIADDLNANDLLFVSPNNERNNSDDDKLLKTIQGIEVHEFDENAEKLLLNNKLFHIDNFKYFIDKIYNDMEELSRHNIGSCEDQFFFGTYKNKKKSEIFYKIADFDTLIIGSHLKKVEKLELKNIKIMLNALFEYITIFIDDSTKEYYQEKLLKEIKDIEKKLSVKQKYVV